MPNPGGRLLPGEYVKLRLVVDRLENAIVVPAPSVMETEVGTIVHVVDGKGKVAVRKVDAAQTYEGMRVITKGLESGVSVIVEGLQSIRPGIVVKTAPAALARKTSEGSKITSALSSGAHTSQVESNLAGPPKS